MARVTVEDCLKNVKNRFELVILAAKRARQLMRGKEPKVEWDNDKATVVALREIAEGFTNFDTHEHHETHETHPLHHTPEQLTPPPLAAVPQAPKENQEQPQTAKPTTPTDEE